MTDREPAIVFDNERASSYDETFARLAAFKPVILWSLSFPFNH